MSWRDNIQICMDVPTEVCNAKGGNCDECSIDRVLEALKAKAGSAFFKNCKQQRKRNAKICQDCPFRAFLEEA